MPMPQYNGPTYGYNPYQTYLKVCPGEDVTLSVTIDANAAFTARRIA